jgi:hypothetical protein
LKKKLGIHQPWWSKPWNAPQVHIGSSTLGAHGCCHWATMVPQKAWSSYPDVLCMEHAIWIKIYPKQWPKCG